MKDGTQVTIDDVLQLVDEYLGDSPWVRVGVSAAVGFAAGLAGGRLVRSGLRFGFALGAKRLARYAFDTAFEAGHRDGLRAVGAGRTTLAHAQH